MSPNSPACVRIVTQSARPPSQWNGATRQHPGRVQPSGTRRVPGACQHVMSLVVLHWDEADAAFGIDLPRTAA